MTILAAVACRKKILQLNFKWQYQFVVVKYI